MSSNNLFIRLSVNEVREFRQIFDDKDHVNQSNTPFL